MQPNDTKRGKVIPTEGAELPEGTVANIEGSFKYLGSHRQLATMWRPRGGQTQPSTYKVP